MYQTLNKVEIGCKHGAYTLQKPKQMDTVTEKKRVRKTVEVPAPVLKKFRDYINGFKYRLDAQEATKFNNQTIGNLMKNNTCSPATLDRIHTLLGIPTPEQNA